MSTFPTKAVLLELTDDEFNLVQRVPCSKSCWRRIARSNKSLTSIPYLESKTVTVNDEDDVVQTSVVVLTVTGYGK
jgi:hypothetical protein